MKIIKNFIPLGRSILNQIYNLLKKNKMSKIKEAKSYQWNKGDSFGKVVEVESVKGKYTNFTDGTRIYTEVLSEFLTEVISGNLPFPGAENTYAASLLDTSVKSSPNNEITKVNKNIVQESAPIRSGTVIIPKSSPLQALIKTISKKNVEGVDVKFNINIPKKNVIEMLVENSEEEKSELVKAVIANAIEEIEINKLQKFLQAEITNFINKYYE